MSKYSTLVKRVSNATAATALALASLTPAIMLGGSAKAAQITGRSISMSDSAANSSSQWTVTLGSTWDNSTISVQVCDSPLFDVTCYNPDDDGVTNSDTTAHDGSPAAVTYSSKTEGTAFAATNPKLVGTFYARITSGSDTGAVAMSTTQDVTINARVQERLTFCVGSDTSANITSRTNCSGSWDQTVDLGVIDSVSTSPVQTSPGSPEGSGNNKSGFFVLATNAFSGAKVNYYPASQLMVSSATCGTNTDTNDQCFNNATLANALASLSGGVEKFGMRITDINRMGTAEGGAEAVTASNSYGSYYMWNVSGEEIASASQAVDYDKANLDFSAAVAAQTPSGFYTTSANFVATGLF